MDNKTHTWFKQILSRFPKQELLGLKTKIIHSTDKTLADKEGIVIDETKNMLHIRDSNNEVFSVEKKNCIFEFILDKERLTAYSKLAKDNNLNLKENKIALELKGTLLCGRPEERIKKKIV
ncbi:MAG: ribonuclease P protein subunit [Candidatus Aenigmarchaeota archaeon]|nr:ribonuclease P protein subunit [Candidatus Aenigmarchaeota archaeon]